MAETTTIDIRSNAFALRLANLLTATREATGDSRRALAAASNGRFHRSELRDFERGTRPLDEETVGELALLYRCDLDAILPPRLPVVITAGRVSAGGVHLDYEETSEEALIQAYMALVRQLRRQKRTPIVDLRRDDLDVLSEYMQQPRESVVHRIANLMNATQRKRTAMVGALSTGVAIVGLVGTAAAVDGPASEGVPVGPSTTGSTTTLVPSTEAPSTTIEIVTTTEAPATTAAPVTTIYVRPTAPRPTTTTSTTMLDVNLTTTSTVQDGGTPPPPPPPTDTTGA